VPLFASGGLDLDLGFILVITGTAESREAATCRYCFYSVAKNQHFAP